MAKRVVGSGMVAVLLALIACSGGSEPPPQARCSPEGIVSVGESIPAQCGFERLDGGTLRLADLAGKPGLINFWASWCPPCIDEMPLFQKVYASLRGRVEFVGANLIGVQGETRGAAQAFARSTGVRYPLIFDEEGLLYSNFSPRLVMPVTILIQSDGVVAHRQFGPINERNLRDLLASKLGVR